MAEYDFTATDLVNIKNAMVSLATGSRKVRVEVGGQTHEFASTSLDKLRSFYSYVYACVNSSAGSGAVNRVRFDDPA